MATMLFSNAFRSTARGQDECLIGFDDGEADVVPDGDGTVSCDECDPNCDADGSKNGMCRFHFRICVNRSDAVCAAVEQKNPKIKGKKVRGFKQGLVPQGTSRVCGEFVDYDVKLKKRGKRAGKSTIRATAVSMSKPRRRDVDKLDLVCNPSPEACPPITEPPSCGNSRVETGEQCDPPGQQGQCAASETCSVSCECVGQCTPCPVTQIETTSTAGVLAVSTLPAFPFPSGVVTVVDMAAADAGCRHDATVPAGGFSVPVFCIPGLGFTSSVTPLGCESGGAFGRGVVWDASAPAPAPNVIRVGDTSDPSAASCGTLGSGCTATEGGTDAGADTAGNIDTSRGGLATTTGVHTQLDIPVRSLTWNDADGNCPDDDFRYDADTDTLVTQFDFILSPTSGTSKATFIELNGDGCSFAGNGPGGTRTCTNDRTKVCGANLDCDSGTCAVIGDCPAGALSCTTGGKCRFQCSDDADGVDGIPATGPCCVVGQTTTVVATGLAFSGGSPLFDLVFTNVTPSSITACGAPTGTDTCTLTTNPCLD
jgi:hypothetical protein